MRTYLYNKSKMYVWSQNHCQDSELSKDWCYDVRYIVTNMKQGSECFSSFSWTHSKHALHEHSATTVLVKSKNLLNFKHYSNAFEVSQRTLANSWVYLHLQHGDWRRFCIFLLQEPMILGSTLFTLTRCPLPIFRISIGVLVKISS